METEEERTARVHRTRDLIAKAQAMAREFFEPGRSMVDELIAERRLEVMRESGWRRSFASANDAHPNDDKAVMRVGHTTNLG